MGSVWLAAHLGLDVPCAVKFLRSEAAESADMRARFEREAKAAARLKSPHVVQTLDHGVWEGTPYIAMEYLEGEDLNHRLKRIRRLDPRDLVRITTHVARALTKAHAAGLVHRDLKPSNIFLVRDDEQEIAKVLDFGVAKRQAGEQSPGEQETRSGSLLGTPHYMSPEQAQGTRVVDHRSDLWSLAVVAYQALTGQLPFQSDALGDLLVQIIVHDPPVPSRVAQVPPTFDAWWARAVARDPSDRFQTAKELAAALAMALGVVVDREGSAGEFSGAWPAGAGLPSIAPQSSGEQLLTPHSLPPLPTPISSISPREQPSSGMNSSGPTANLVAQSVSIAQPPLRRRKSIVVLASIAGVAIGAVVAVYAPAEKGADDAAPSASVAPASGSTAAVPASTPNEPVAATPTSAASAPPAAANSAPREVNRAPAWSATPTPRPNEAKPKSQGAKPAGHKRPDFGI